MQLDSRHQCLIYDGPPSRKLAIIADILKLKMDEGFRCLYLNSTVMVAGMSSTLASKGMDVTHELGTTRLVLSSVPVSSDKEFDSDEMLCLLEDYLDQAINDGFKGLWVTGDITWEFGPTQSFSKLLEYEWGLEELFRRRNELSGICQYHLDTLPLYVMRQSLITHPSIIINETLSRINPHYLKSKDSAINTTTREQDAMIVTLCALG